MRNWDDLKYCLALCRHGTMSDAAKVLGTNVATVSRRLHRLSEEIGETLFIKEGNRWAVTQAGAELALIAAQMQTRISQSGGADRAMKHGFLLRISCAMQIMQCGLVDGIVTFLERHEQARLKLDTHKLSLALNECDLRIGFDEPGEGRIVRRLMTALEIVPACNPAFKDALQGWVNVDYTDAGAQSAQFLLDYFGAPPTVEIEGLNLTRLILKSNPLLAPLPKKLVDRDDDLVEVSVPGRFGSLPVWLSYHESRRRDAAVRIAVQFLEDAMRIEPQHATASVV